MRRGLGGMGGLMNAYAALDGGSDAEISALQTGPKTTTTTTTTTTTAPKVSTTTKKVAPVAKPSPSTTTRSSSNRGATTTATATATHKIAPTPVKTISSNNKTATVVVSQQQQPSAKQPAPKVLPKMTSTQTLKTTSLNEENGDNGNSLGNNDDNLSSMLREISTSSDQAMTTLQDETTTFTLDEEKVFQKEVETLKQKLASENKKFTHVFNQEEEAKYDWIRLSDLGYTLFPNGNNASAISASQILQGSHGDCWMASVIAVLTHSRKDIVQNLFVVKEMNAQCVYAVRLWGCGKWHNVLLDDRFPVKKGSFDGSGKAAAAALPSLLFADCGSSLKCFWVAMLEKAVAAFHGSYESLRGGVSMEAFLDFTGLPVTKVRLNGSAASSTTQAAAATVSSPDEIVTKPEALIKKLQTFFKARNVMAASCGGNTAQSAQALKFKLRPEHSYSVLELRSIAAAASTIGADSQYFLRLRDPWGSSEASLDIPKKVLESLPKIDSENNNGEFWISINQFMSAYNLLVCCISHSFAHVVSSATKAICTPETSYLPSNLLLSSAANGGEGGGIEFAVVPSKETPVCTLYLMASQPQLRSTNSNNTNTAKSSSFQTANDQYFDLSVMLLKLPLAEVSSNNNNAASQSVIMIPKLVAWSEVTVDRIVYTSVSVKEPGRYIAFPMSFQQHKFKSSQDLFVTVLVEKKSESAFRLISRQQQQHETSLSATSSRDITKSPIFTSINKWLFKYIESQPDAEIRYATNNLWDIIRWSNGYMRVSLVRSITDQSSSVIDVDTTNSVHTTTVSSPDGKLGSEVQYQVVLGAKPKNNAAIVHLAVPLPWSAAERVTTNASIAWKFKTNSAVKEISTSDLKVAQMFKPFSTTLVGKK